jgi:hypothetical protein
MAPNIDRAAPVTEKGDDASSFSSSAGRPNQYTRRLPSRRNSAETKPVRRKAAPSATMAKVGPRIVRISTRAGLPRAL